MVVQMLFVDVVEEEEEEDQTLHCFVKSAAKMATQLPSVIIDMT